MIDVEFVTKFVMPPILGGIAGFFSPWAKHYFENRIVRRNDRRAFIQKCKHDLLVPDAYFEGGKSESISDIKISSETGILTPEESYRRLFKHPTFALLKPHMSQEAIRKLDKYDGSKITLVLGANENLVRKIIVREIHELEKKWKLLSQVGP